MASKKASKTGKAKTTKAAATKKATRRAQRPAKASGRKAATKKATSGTAAPSSRKAAIIDLISRSGGASLAELMTATGWQAHSVRGMICTLGKTMKIASAKADGERRYTA